MSEYTEKYSTDELAKEMAVIKVLHSMTGKVDQASLDFLLTAAISLDLAVRKAEKVEEEHKQAVINLEADLFSKDIEIAELTDKLAEKETNA